MYASIGVTLTQWGEKNKHKNICIGCQTNYFKHLFTLLFFVCVVGQNGSVQLFCMTLFFFLFRFYQIDPDTRVDACP